MSECSICYNIVMEKNNKQTSFASIIHSVENVIPSYRRSIFRLSIICMIIGHSNKCMASIIRAVFFLGEFSECSHKSISKRFYSFLQTKKIKWDCLWRGIIAILIVFCIKESSCSILMIPPMEKRVKRSSTVLLTLIMLTK